MKSLKRSLQERIAFLKLKAGDAEAFVFFYDRYAKNIYRFVLIKVSDREVAQDLTQEIFLKIWQHLLDKKDIRNFRAFIFRIARNMVIDHYRQSNSQELPLEYIPEVAEATDEQRQKMDKSLDTEHLLQALKKLKDEYQEVIFLRYVEDLSIDDIAQIIEKEKGSVRVLLHRAINKLKEITSHLPPL